MADFPTLPKPWEIKETSITDTIATPFESGYVQTRSRNTRPRKRWVLAWGMLTTAQVGTLRTFFETTVRGKAGAFNWTHPFTAVVYSVRFAKDELPADLIGVGQWSVETELEQV